MVIAFDVQNYTLCGRPHLDLTPTLHTRPLWIAPSISSTKHTIQACLIVFLLQKNTDENDFIYLAFRVISVINGSNKNDLQGNARKLEL